MAETRAAAGGVAAAMDRMYRHQRHLYDATRKFYLLGRDAMLDALALRPGETACEIGCGTARNLIRLACRHPEARLHGIDASAAMLRTAAAAVARAGLAGRITLAQGLAQDIDPARLGRPAGFDVVFVSYALSMIPDWRGVLDRAQAALRPGGRLGLVDFANEPPLPAPARALLARWLALFGVVPRPELAIAMRAHAAVAGGFLAIDRVGAGTAVRIRWIKPAGTG